MRHYLNRVAVTDLYASERSDFYGAHTALVHTSRPHSSVHYPHQGNLIYLSRISDRIPVLPPFTSHISGDKAPLPFSRVFDVPRMSRAIGTPVLDWTMIKDIQHALREDMYDQIGCWSIWEVQDVAADGPRGSYTPVLLNLGTSR